MSGHMVTSTMSYVNSNQYRNKSRPSGRWDETKFHTDKLAQVSVRCDRSVSFIHRHRDKENERCVTQMGMQLWLFTALLKELHEPASVTPQKNYLLRCRRAVRHLQQCILNMHAIVHPLTIQKFAHHYPTMSRHISDACQWLRHSKTLNLRYKRLGIYKRNGMGVLADLSGKTIGTPWQIYMAKVSTSWMI